MSMTTRITPAHDHTKKCIDSNNSESNGTKSLPLKLGALYFNGKHCKNEKIFTAAGLLTSVTFTGAKFVKKQEKKSAKYISNNSGQVEVKEMPT